AAGSATTQAQLSAGFSGLKARASYRFLNSARDARDTRAFPTRRSSDLPNPPTVLTGTAASVTQTTATLAASVNPNGGNVTECRYKCGPPACYPVSATCPSPPWSGTRRVEVSAQISGLKASTTCHSRVAA